MNPFIIAAYKSPEFFCDREKERDILINSVSNGVNILLYSLRRMGKTGLIKHSFHKLALESNYHLIYLDIYRTKNVSDFVNELANAMLKINRKPWYKKAFDLIKSLRPVFTINPLSGQMEVEIKALNSTDETANLEAILNFFEQYSTKVIIAIDEFQQITEYPEKGFEAFLRSKIQFLNNVNFIYSGSNRRIISAMFNDYNRPFYQSGSTLFLDKIPTKVYASFIEKLMKNNARLINNEIILEGLNWTDSFTWFTQNYFNRIWGKGEKTITEDLIFEVKSEIFDEKERDFIELRNLLPENQMNLLSAIAKENGTSQPTSKEFLKLYNLGSSSTVNSALKVLIQKELIYHENNKYQLYDIYLKRFFQH